MESVFIPSRSELLGSNVDQNINIFSQLLKDDYFTTINLPNHFKYDGLIAPTNNLQNQDLTNAQLYLERNNELKMPTIIPSYGNETTWTSKELERPDLDDACSVVFEQALEPASSEVAFRGYPIMRREPVFQDSDYRSMILEPGLNINQMNHHDDGMFPQNFLDVQLLTSDDVQDQQNVAENTSQASTDEVEDVIILENPERTHNRRQFDSSKSMKAYQRGTILSQPFYKQMKPNAEIPISSNACRKKTLNKNKLEVELGPLGHMPGVQSLDENASQTTIVHTPINYDNQHKHEKNEYLKDTSLKKLTGALSKKLKYLKPYSEITSDTTKFLANFCSCLHCKKVFQSFEDLRKHHLSHEKVQVNVLNYKKTSKFLLGKRKLQIRLKKLELNKDLCKRVKSSWGRKINNRKSDCKKGTPKLGTSNIAQACLHCKKTFSDLEDLRKHHLCHEKVKIINKCYQCYKTFSEFNVLMNHIKTHALEKYAEPSNFNCKHCEETFSTRSEMIKHLKSHVFLHKCRQCGKTFSLRSSLSRHIRTHTREPHFSHYRCTHCDDTFDTTLELDKHISLHSNLSEKSFQQNIDLNEPLSTHSNSRESHENMHSDGNNLNQNLKMPTKSLHLCLQCGIAFTDKSVLDIHILSHLGQNPHTCDDCGMAYTNELKLRRHVLSHAKRKHHKCAHCGKVFVQKHDLNVHILSHLNEVQSVVSQNNSEQFKQYLRDKSNSSNVMVPKLLHLCLICKKTFNSFEDLKVHRQDCVQNDPSSCNSNQMNDLKNRMQEQDLMNTNNQDVQPDDDLVVLYDTHIYKCNGCTEVFPSNTRLVEHQKQHCSELLHKCFQCEESFSGQSQLKLHLIDYHSEGQHSSEKLGSLTLRDYLEADTRRQNILPYTCNQCGKSFSEKWHLNRHMRNHLPSNSVGEVVPKTPSLEAFPYRCSPCGKLFSHKWRFNRHMLTHPTEKVHKCGFCEWAFRNASDLSRHLLIHSNEETYKCSFCNQRFLNENSLKEHFSLRKCNQFPLCGLAFGEKQELNRPTAFHERFEKYKCSECGKVFSFKKYLTKHMKVHTAREKCHQCKQCGNRFFRNSDMRRHMLIHLREKM